MDVVIAPLFGLHCVLGPRDVIPNLELISSLADHIEIDIWSMIPSLSDELGEAPDILPKLSRSKFICASGGKTVVLMPSTPRRLLIYIITLQGP